MKGKFVVDTSVIVEKIISGLLKQNKIEGSILIPNFVIAELENQANRGQEIGLIGLEEIQEIRKSKKLKIEFVGGRPSEFQIKLAKSGEIDAAIREIAFKEKAVLITADRVQAESAKAFGTNVEFIEPKEPKSKLEFEKYFDEHTMSIHLMEKCFVYGKKGMPGNWKLEKISDKELDREKLRELAKEIVERTKIDPESFVEISRRGSTIVQYKDYRIVIVKPPVSDGWEITIIKPIKKLKIEDYKLSDKIFNRIKDEVRGVIIAGEVGSGKSTFVQALGELYKDNNKIVKTVESPRDLQLSREITQYSKNFTSSAEIHDILFLSRPDYILFDEMRDTPDFELYSDLRLGGSNCLGVLHAASPINAVQRFIGRLDTGMIPSVLDTIIFIEGGKLKKILTLKMLVKVPSGMTEEDLARPVVEIKDFDTGKLEFEIYSYGEETVVIPVEENGKKNKKGIRELAAREIERELMSFTDKVKAEMISDSRAVIYVPEFEIAKIIGSEGKTIEKIEKALGVGIEVKELEEISNKKNLRYEVKEDKRALSFYVEPGNDVDFYVDGKFLFRAISSRKGEINIHKKSKSGRVLLSALDNKRKVELKA